MILCPLVNVSESPCKAGRKNVEQSHFVYPNSIIINAIHQMHVLLTVKFLLMGIDVLQSLPPPPWKTCQWHTDEEDLTVKEESEVAIMDHQVMCIEIFGGNCLGGRWSVCD